MSYYACGGGEVFLKNDVPDSVINLLKECEFCVYPLPDGDGLGIEFDYGKYHDDEANDCMNAIAPYVARGDVEFTGEDGQFRFHFDDGTVIEENAEYFYPSDAEHGKRTFTVRYYHSEGKNETQFDIDDKDFVDMMNELLALTYQVADESGEHNVEIYEIEEVPYDGEED